MKILVKLSHTLLNSSLPDDFSCKHPLTALQAQRTSWNILHWFSALYFFCVYLCLFVWMSVSVCLFVWECVSVCECVSVWVCVWVCECVCMYVFLLICLCVSVFVCLFACLFVCVCVFLFISQPKRAALQMPITCIDWRCR